jgi:hypothetical protein
MQSTLMASTELYAKVCLKNILHAFVETYKTKCNVSNTGVEREIIKYICGPTTTNYFCGISKFSANM